MMANVKVIPMPDYARKLSPQLWPNFPPIFDDDPTPEDIALARKLFMDLDEQSKEFYRRSSIFDGLE
jgi:hypothetical protein